ncbi:hypothetical protein [Streptomyces avermitilis]
MNTQRPTIAIVLIAAVLAALIVQAYPAMVPALTIAVAVAGLVMLFLKL